MSEENTSLVFLANADKALAQATDVWKLKEFRDQMLTVHDYAERHKLSVVVIDKARAYALEAEKRLGEEIAKMPKNVGAKGSIVSGDHRVPLKDETPTLEELGISKKLSSQAQELAKLPPDKFEKLKDGKTTRKNVKAELKKAKVTAKVEEMAQAAEALAPDERYKIHAGDMANVDFWFDDGPFDAVISDPPYPQEFLPLFGTLAEHCRDYLKENGLVVLMCGQTHLPRILELMTPHLRYYWTGCLYMPSANAQPIQDRPMLCNWKPLLMFCRKEARLFDLPPMKDVFLDSGVSSKDQHEWQQGETGMLAIVRACCKPGMRVLDPFSGSGTTGVACLQHGCLYTGIELDETAAKASIKRLSEVKP